MPSCQFRRDERGSNSRLRSGVPGSCRWTTVAKLRLNAHQNGPTCAHQNEPTREVGSRVCELKGTRRCVTLRDGASQLSSDPGREPLRSTLRRRLIFTRAKRRPSQGRRRRHAVVEAQRRAFTRSSIGLDTCTTADATVHATLWTPRCHASPWVERWRAPTKVHVTSMRCRHRAVVAG